MVRKAVYNAETGETRIIEVEDEFANTDIEELRRLMLDENVEKFKEVIVQGFTSSVTGEEVRYRYKTVDQGIYTKWATAFSLNPNKTEATFDTDSHGMVTLTREQFIQLMDDIEMHELGKFMIRKQYQTQIESATTVEELEAINIVF